MSELPRTLDETLDQCNQALSAAIEAGKRRLQIEIKVPGVEMLTLVRALASSLGPDWVAVFPDPGAAALARRELAGVEYDLRGISELRSSIERYSAFVLIETSIVEVEAVEALAQRAAGKPFILLNSRLQESGVVGIGLTGRQLRDRFLSTIETIYAIQPIESGATYRAYPGPWQLWREEKDGDYTLLSELAGRPTGEDIDKAFSPKGEGLLDGLRRFLRVLGQ